MLNLRPAACRARRCFEVRSCGCRREVGARSASEVGCSMASIVELREGVGAGSGSGRARASETRKRRRLVRRRGRSTYRFFETRYRWYRPNAPTAKPKMAPRSAASAHEIGAYSNPCRRCERQRVCWRKGSERERRTSSVLLTKLTSSRKRTTAMKPPRRPVYERERTKNLRREAGVSSAQARWRCVA